MAKTCVDTVPPKKKRGVQENDPLLSDDFFCTG